MSYDYILVKGQIDVGLEALVEGAVSQTIGSAQDVMTSIGNVFPSTRWQKGPGQGWFGLADEAEIMFLIEADDAVQMLHMSSCEREAVQRVAKELNLVAIDEQSMEQFDG
jgi:hypothetical protein